MTTSGFNAALGQAFQRLAKHGGAGKMAAYEALGSLLDVPPPTIREWVAGRRRPATALANRLAADLKLFLES